MVFNELSNMQNHADPTPVLSKAGDTVGPIDRNRCSICGKNYTGAVKNCTCGKN
ncbi:dc0fc3b6-687d-49cb-a5f5-35c6b8cacd0c [Thermothielavioides terrestris]|uniref:Dc0fc3b6-687d-49cb-a5f5-35c6b8cacd0c n=1 Tax=Thermothielavioides terrestris TaxID=2587410 RepID=A0A446BQX9_9PEZI|nr:dc0fc3b6-687d-49cb-a5f5-35c6b8cacd0c [Thermothielavioides terrestris]